MVARGDLGVDVPLEDVPHLQQEIIRQARAAKVPVIVATQMLESMVTHLRPTRAEVSDVATAIFEGADAIMLSAGDGHRRYPAEAVEVMARIAMRAEQSVLSQAPIRRRRTDAEVGVGFPRRCPMPPPRPPTRSTPGPSSPSRNPASRARLISHERPDVPIIALTPSVEVRRRLGAVVGRGLAAHPQGGHDRRAVRSRSRRRCSSDGTVQRQRPDRDHLRLAHVGGGHRPTS